MKNNGNHNVAHLNINFSDDLMKREKPSSSKITPKTYDKNYVTSENNTKVRKSLLNASKPSLSIKTTPHFDNSLEEDKEKVPLKESRKSDQHKTKEVKDSEKYIRGYKVKIWLINS